MSKGRGRDPARDTLHDAHRTVVSDPPQDGDLPVGQRLPLRHISLFSEVLLGRSEGQLRIATGRIGAGKMAGQQPLAQILRDEPPPSVHRPKVSNGGGLAGHDLSIDDQRTYAELLAELEALRAENARLRSLLGLDDRAHDLTVAGWSPTLFAPQPSAMETKQVVDRSSPRAAKVALFRSLFAGREDVYALRWENTRTGKGGWGPAVRGGWANARRPDP